MLRRLVDEEVGQVCFMDINEGCRSYRSRLRITLEMRKNHKRHSYLNRSEKKSTKENRWNHATGGEKRRWWFAVDTRQRRGKGWRLTVLAVASGGGRRWCLVLAGEFKSV